MERNGKDRSGEKKKEREKRNAKERRKEMEVLEKLNI